MKPISAIILLIASLIAANPSVAAGSAPGLPRDIVVGAGPEMLPSDQPSVLRQRDVMIRPDALAGIQAGQALRLGLFAETTLIGIVDRIATRSAQSVSLTGHLQEPDAGAFQIVVHKGAVDGTFQLPGVNGSFRLTGLNGRYIAQQVLQEALPPCGTSGAQAVPVPGLDSLPPAPEAPENDGDGPQIDVMFVYTPAVKAALGGVAAAEARAQLAVDIANQAYQNSGIDASLRLVRVEEVAFTETADVFNEALDKLTNTGDGVMDDVHSWRDYYGADAVCLLVEDMQYCGLAWLMTGLSSGFATHGFEVVNYYCAADYTYAHELGHNQGCHHDRENSGGGQGLYPYSFGWRFTGQDSVQYRTVMSYAPGTRIPYFSNPNISYEGVPTGKPEGDPLAAYNSLTINNSASTVAQWRPARPQIDIVSVGVEVVEESCLPANGTVDPDETVTVRLTLKNAGESTTGEIRGLLEISPGILPLTTTYQSFGTIGPNASASALFRFTASGACGSSRTLNLRVRDDRTVVGVRTFPITLGIVSTSISSVYSSDGVNVPVLDNATVDVPITVADAGMVTDVNVKLRAAHTYVGDLDILLIGPDGTSVPLISYMGGGGNDLGRGSQSCDGTFTVFDDDATTSVASGTAPFAGSYKPAGSLSTFTGRPTEGTWILRLRDVAPGDQGTLWCWQLDLTRGAFSCCSGPPPFTLADGLAAMRIAGGFQVPTPADVLRFDVDPSDGQFVCLGDAVRILAKVAGRDPNP